MIYSDKPNGRSSHMRIGLRGGGLVFYLGVAVYFIVSGGTYPWFMAGLTLISLISFLGDVWPVSQKVRLAFHLFAMALLFYQWGLFAFPWWTTLVALIVCMGMVNTYHFMEGINGMTGGYSLVVLVALAFVNSLVGGFVEPGLIYTAIAAVVVFCFFNFRKRARCLAGDIGSASIAFILLFLIGQLILDARDFSWLVFLAVYGVDSALTVIYRLLLPQNTGLPHRKPMLQLMANELHLPHRMVPLIYIGGQALIILGYFLFLPYGYLYLFAVVLILSAVYILFMWKLFRLHSRK